MNGRADDASGTREYAIISSARDTLARLRLNRGEWWLGLLLDAGTSAGKEPEGDSERDRDRLGDLEGTLSSAAVESFAASEERSDTTGDCASCFREDVKNFIATEIGQDQDTGSTKNICTTNLVILMSNKQHGLLRQHLASSQAVTIREIIHT